MKRLDPVSLSLFIAIAEGNSLTAAAAREHLALAAVSKRVRDLENQLGTVLLYRHPRGVELTPAGNALHHHARTILDDMDRLSAELSEYSRGVRGHVRIHANTSAVIEFLPEDLSSFARAHPEIKIDLQESLSNEAVEAVRDGRTDIGIFARVESVDDLHTQIYRHDHLVLVTPRDHPLAEHRSVALVDALAYDFIGLQQSASLHDLIATAARSAQRPLRMRIQVRSFEAICRMIAHGMGIGVLPRKAVTPVSGLGLALSIVELSDDWARRTLWLGTRADTPLPVIARDMLEHLADPQRSIQHSQHD